MYKDFILIILYKKKKPRINEALNLETIPLAREKHESYKDR